MKKLLQLVDKYEIQSSEKKEGLISSILECIGEEKILYAIIDDLGIKDKFNVKDYNNLGLQIRGLVNFLIDMDGGIGNLIDQLGMPGYCRADDSWSQEYFALRGKWALLNVDYYDTLPPLAGPEKLLFEHYNKILANDDDFGVELGKRIDSNWRVLLFHLLFDEKKFEEFALVCLDPENQECRKLYYKIKSRFQLQISTSPTWLGKLPVSNSLSFVFERQQSGCYHGKVVSLPYRKIIKKTEKEMSVSELSFFVNNLLVEFRHIYRQKAELVEFILDIDDLLELDYSDWEINDPDISIEKKAIDAVYPVGVRSMSGVKSYNPTKLDRLWDGFKRNPSTYEMLLSHFNDDSFGKKYKNKEHNAIIQKFTTTDKHFAKIRDFLNGVIIDGVPVFLFFRKCTDLAEVEECDILARLMLSNPLGSPEELRSQKYISTIQAPHHVSKISLLWNDPGNFVDLKILVEGDHLLDSHKRSYGT